ncbi:MAG TPA: TetR/AcrR family transcriptional regulator [Candidatus Deferrimicrobiaceae bacterium]|nr:TetR/AcrR family transcriptional regulator [Candidatus Deferrimicrobiaceae bacterium]
MSDTTRSRAILATASRLFAKKGYSQATTAEIAREAGVAEGTLYHHFGSKDGIFLTLFDETMEGFLSGIEEILAGGRTGREALSALVRFHFGYVSRHREQFLILLRDFPVHLTVEHLAAGLPQRVRIDRITELFSRVLARGKSDGTLHLPFPVRETAEMLRGSFYGTTRLKMLDLIQAPLPRLARMMESYWQKALAPPRVMKNSRRAS